MKTSATALALVALGLLAGRSLAGVPNEALVCVAEAPELDPGRYLRALSLDLRGRLPTLAEYDAVAADPDAIEELLDEWLQDEAFAERVVRQHRALLWNNVSNVNLLGAATGLRKEGDRYFRNQTAPMYRGARVPCADEPVRLSPDGVILTDPGPDGTELEGWVEVTPYWDPTLTLKVCAFDAQDALVSPSGTSCKTTAGFSDPGCGCGPNLAWCRLGRGQTDALMAAIAEDMDRRIERLIAEDRPYLDLFADNRAWVNGPIVHYLKWQTGVHGAIRVLPEPLPVDRLPDLEFTDEDTWVEVRLPEEHAGVLTSLAYLLRFQTNRARANRFYNAFMCEPFQAPSAGIDLTQQDGTPNPDLQQRSGCKYCHAQLEPAASYWGRWTQQGAGYLDPQRFPATRADCVQCAATGSSCSDDCKRYYHTSAAAAAEEPYLGMLDAYVFRAEQHRVNVEEGPRLLAFEATATGRLPDCVAEKTARWLLGRETGAGEQGWIEELAVDFVASGFSYRELVRAIVTSETYRRAL